MKMRKFITLATLILLAGGIVILCSAAKPKGKSDSNTKSALIMSYNIRACMGDSKDNTPDPARIINVLKKVDADVIALQEVDSMTKRCPFNTMEELAKATGMHYVFGPAINYRGGKYGVGILSKEKPISCINIPLPGSKEKRTLLVAEFNDYYFASTHIDFNPDEQVESMNIIARQANTVFADKPFIVAGDFNFEPDDAPFTTITKELGFSLLNDKHVFTFNAQTPSKCIDFILIRKAGAESVKVKKRIVMNEPSASDHRPVYVIVEYK